MVWTIISFIIIFSVVVIAHEFGHFLIARQNGIQVNEFAIGMGPVIYKKVFGTTRFVIRLLPIGGACIFEGEDGNYEGEEEQEKHDEIAREGTFSAAPVWGRIATVVAGPLFNIILAYVLSLFLCWFCGSDLPIISGVTEGYPAEAAGMQAVVTDGFLARGNGRWTVAFDLRARSENPFSLRVQLISNEKTFERKIPVLAAAAAELTPWKRYEVTFDTDFDPVVTDLVAVSLTATDTADEIAFRNLSFSR